MNDEPQAPESGLLGRARRLADDALKYARSDEARAKFAGTKKMTVEVGGKISDRVRGLVPNAGRSTTNTQGDGDLGSNPTKSRPIFFIVAGVVLVPALAWYILLKYHEGHPQIRRDRTVTLEAFYYDEPTQYGAVIKDEHGYLHTLSLQGGKVEVLLDAPPDGPSSLREEGYEPGPYLYSIHLHSIEEIRKGGPHPIK